MSDPSHAAPGPLMLDVAGCSLDESDRELLAHPVVGGLILFARNFECTEQLDELVRQIRSVRPQILIAVDQEGGRVQRFKNGFTRLPCMRALGNWYDAAPREALIAAFQCGWLMAAELRGHDIDLSFAPVLDLDYGQSAVIGDRAFHSDPEVASELAGAFIRGMRDAGMASTGKHFPGHGYVAGDSHLEIPEDPRDLTDLLARDMVPFQRLFSEGLDAVMPAHVIYTSVDQHPAGFSPRWLREILRTEMAFDGVIFSDDLSMEGATVAGSFTERASAALYAGCDMVLVCNDRPGALEVLEYLSAENAPPPAVLKRMRGQAALTADRLRAQARRQTALQSVQEIGQHLA